MANRPKYRTLPPRPSSSSAAREKTAHQRGYGKGWRKVADSILDRDCSLCVMCIAEGGVFKAAETLAMTPANSHGTKPKFPVDHIVPVHVRPDLFNDESNLQVLCPRHHAAKTAEDLKVYGAAPR